MKMMMNELKESPALRRPRGRPRKSEGGGPAEDRKKRGTQKSHSPEHYAEIRYKRKIAGIIHKQFLVLEEDEGEAETLLAKLTDRATAAYHAVSLKESLSQNKVLDPAPESDPSELDPLVEGIAPVAALPALPEPSSPSPPPPIPENKTEASRTLPGARKPISERGKLVLKAFRK